MIQNKSDLRYYIQEDKKANLGSSPISFTSLLIKIFYPTEDMKAWKLLKALRHAEYAKNCLMNKGLIGNVIYAYRQWYYHKLAERYNIMIGTNMVGYGLYLPHIVGGGIIINCNKMGNYCSVNVGVVIGNNHSWDDRPYIGDNVKITMGSKIYGGCHIGNNVIIAPNSVVYKDVPDNSVVSGVPASIIKTRQTTA